MPSDARRSAMRFAVWVVCPTGWELSSLTYSDNVWAASCWMASQSTCSTRGCGGGAAGRLAMMSPPCGGIEACLLACGGAQAQVVDNFGAKQQVLDGQPLVEAVEPLTVLGGEHRRD